MITDWETNFTDLQANDFGSFGKNNSGNILVGNHAVILTEVQKKRDVHKISTRNSGAGNGCADFMGAWHFLVLSAGKPPCP